MATVGSLAYTMTDWIKRNNPDGTYAKVAEILSRSNPILEDAPMVEANGVTTHRTTVRVGLPAVTWRRFNEGVALSKSIVRQVDDSIGMLEAFSQVDKALADLNGNTAEFRMSEDVPFLEAMTQAIAGTFFYGNAAVNPERFHGLAPRYATLGTSATADTATPYNVFGAGGAGSDNTSLWLVGWSENTVHFTFPKGLSASAGLVSEDTNGGNPETILDGSGNPYIGYRRHYMSKLGCVVRDWRYISRLANIDVSDLYTAGKATDTSARLIPEMIRMMNRIPNLRSVKPVFYCNRDVKTALDVQAQNKANVYLTVKEYAGELVTMFRGIPIKQCDALLNNEAAVS